MTRLQFEDRAVVVGFSVGAVWVSLLQNKLVSLFRLYFSAPGLLIQWVPGKFSLELEWLEHEASHSYPSSSMVKNKNYEVNHLV
jgi:hypothetical protein